MRRRYSKPPQVGSKARAPSVPAPGEVSSELKKFRDTYTFERRFLEQYRSGKPSSYNPPKVGGSKWAGPEEPKTKGNTWEKAYLKLKNHPDVPDPCLYVRILFRILRESSLATPQVQQLVSPNMLRLVADFLQDVVIRMRQQFVAESQRAEIAIRVNEKGAGYPFGLAVYYAIVDSRVGLSPLYKYCLASEACQQLAAKKSDTRYSVTLKSLAKEYELTAAMDYCCFPKLYDEVWGNVIPSKFRVAACGYVDSAIKQN